MIFEVTQIVYDLTNSNITKFSLGTQFTPLDGEFHRDVEYVTIALIELYRYVSEVVKMLDIKLPSIYKCLMDSTRTNEAISVSKLQRATNMIFIEISKADDELKRRIK